MRWFLLLCAWVVGCVCGAPAWAQEGARSVEEWQRSEWPAIAERICAVVPSDLCGAVREHPGWATLRLNGGKEQRLGFYAIVPNAIANPEELPRLRLQSAPSLPGEPFLSIELNVPLLDPRRSQHEDWVTMEDPRHPGHPPAGVPMMYGELSRDGELYALRDAVFELERLELIESDGLLEIYRMSGRLEGMLVRKLADGDRGAGESFSLAGSTINCLYIVDRRAGALFQAIAPEYIRAQIPSDPGHVSITVLDESGAELPAVNLGFIGTAQVFDRPATEGVFPVARLLSPPNERVRFGLEFYPGAGFRWGNETKIAITEENRYSPNRSLGTIRVWAGVGPAHYEVQSGRLTISVFHPAPLPATAQLDPGVRLQMWRLRGSFSGQLVRSDQGARESEPVTIQSAHFDCLLIQDVAPVAGGDGQAEIVLEDYLSDRLTLRETSAHLERILGAAGDPDTWLLDLRAETGRGGDDRFGFHFQSWSAGQINLPLVARYTLSADSRGVPERFLRTKPPGTLVMSWSHHPQADLQLHYWPSEATLRIDESYLMLRHAGAEYWRVRGSFSGKFEYYKKIDPIDPLTELQRDRVTEIDRFTMTRGTFDVVLTRQTEQSASWREEFPGLPDPTLIEE